MRAPRTRAAALLAAGLVGACGGGKGGGGADDAAADDTAADDTAGEAAAVTGFGADTVGGTGGEVVMVTSLAASGEGSLRAAVDVPEGPLVVRFAVDGTIENTNAVELPSYVTLDATGRDVTLAGGCLRVDGHAEIILRNLRFRDCHLGSDAALELTGGAHHVVVDHCTFSAPGLPAGEAPPAILAGSAGGAINVAWSRFEDLDDAVVLGDEPAGDTGGGSVALTASLHHDLFRDVGRGLVVRAGLVDAWDDLLLDWAPRSGEGEAAGMVVEGAGQLRAEADRFGQADADWPLGAGVASEEAALAVDDAVLEEDWIEAASARPEAVFARPYEAGVEPADDDLRARILDEAGAGG